ncbi:protein TolR [Laribacter hongkongensis]|nr:protein TolR [Laribacter hongkongensis]MCG9023407.1 protein TolR [Laribacter hongkongensis]MCG9074208.1 protein TolR [Laribacter hongkongensis]
MLNRRPRRSMSQINVVPYIDVMLVLLVIFMVTAPMFAPGVVNLPSVGRAAQVETEPLQVTIGKDGEYGLADKGKTTSYGEVPALVAAIQSDLAGDGQRPVVISADKTVAYEKVMDVMSALQKARVERVGLLVKSEQ